MKSSKLLLMLILGLLLAAGCVEEISRGENMEPRVWFERSPAESSVVFANAVEFEWRASDWDDDLGMGATYVKLDTLHAGDDDWERVYDVVYGLLDLPDSTFDFRVRIVDPRDAETIITRNFTVRFDPNMPVVDSLWAPPAKMNAIDFTANYTCFAHDVAPNPDPEGDPLPWPQARSASPPESLKFYVSMVGPGCFDTEEIDYTYGKTYQSGPTSRGAYYTYSVTIPGASCQGEYTFRVQVKDRAGNATEVVMAKCRVSK